MAEKKDEISIEDIDVDTFRRLLRFLYTDKAEITASSAFPCLYAAKKYCTTGLVEACIQFLIDATDTENVCEIYNQSLDFGEIPLQENCLSFICHRAQDVLESTEFLSLKRKALVQVLESDSLDLPEVEVFQAVIQWATHQCQGNGMPTDRENIRRCLGDIFYLVRMPLIPTEEFTDVVIESNVLSTEEQLELYKQNTRSKRETFESKYSFKERETSCIELTTSGESQANVGFGFAYDCTIRLNISGNNRFELRRITLDAKSAESVKTIEITFNENSTTKPLSRTVNTQGMKEIKLKNFIIHLTKIKTQRTRAYMPSKHGGTLEFKFKFNDCLSIKPSSMSTHGETKQGAFIHMEGDGFSTKSFLIKSFIFAQV